jgi:hypothetical protein
LELLWSESLRNSESGPRRVQEPDRRYRFFSTSPSLFDHDLILPMNMPIRADFRAKRPTRAEKGFLAFGMEATL